MTYFADLSEYTYGGSQFARRGTRNVGWLGRGHRFPTKQPSDEILDLLWGFCSISVALARGGHNCELCPSGTANFPERNGQKLFLGAAEIRVLSEDGRIYAAPNLIYHYVLVHRYQPPDEFTEALCTGPRPPQPEYFEQLEKLGLKWKATATGEGLRRPGDSRV